MNETYPKYKVTQVSSLYIAKNVHNFRKYARLVSTPRQWEERTYVPDEHNEPKLRCLPVTHDGLIDTLERHVQDYERQRSQSRGIDSLYNANGQRVSLATGRPVVRQRKQPRGTWRRGDDERGA